MRLTLTDIEAGKDEVVMRRTNSGDGGLAQYAVTCEGDINWEELRIIGREKIWNQRKVLEGIESLRQRDQGITQQLQPIRTMAGYTKQMFWRLDFCMCLYHLSMVVGTSNILLSPQAKIKNFFFIVFVIWHSI